MARFHAIQRFLTLTGLIVAVAAAIICAGEIPSWDRATLEASAHGERGQLVKIALYCLAGGLGLALVTLAIDLVVGIFSTAGRRSALGVSVILQVALAAALLVGVNYFSFLHYQRCDLTRDRVFTLKPETVAELKKLRSDDDSAKTTIVVYQQHKGAGRLTDKPQDRYDAAAERKVVEKVKDLVEQLREFGPQFRVVVLDVEEEGFDHKLAEETAKCRPLDAAIKSAPESSIFFCSGNNVQRMGFSEFYVLDKTASTQANDGRGNLVLLNQGIEPFARRVLAIEEKKPRIAVLVSHPWLSTEGQVEEYTLAGLRKSLTNYGFDVRDILTNKLVGRRGRGLRLEKAALSIEESRTDRVEAQLTAVRLQISQTQAEIAQAKKYLDLFKSTMSDDEVSRKLSEMIGRRVTVDAEARARNITTLTERLPEVESDLAQKQQKERDLEKDLDALQAQEKVAEGQRESDLKKKLSNLLSDCDALIISRMTMIDTAIGDVVPNSLHQLDEKQLEAIKDFMKAGKPVMFCVGPTNEPSESDVPGARPTPPADNLETMMAEVGLVFAPQAVLYDAEAEAYATNQVLAFGRGGGSENIPPLEFPEGEVPTGSLTDRAEKLKTNPLARSLELVQRSAGAPIDLRVRYPRPIYFRPLRGNQEKAASFLETIRASWNEDNPYPTDERPVPRYEAPKPDDPSRGTRNERRRGPFPVGVAVETTLPIQWYDPAYGAADAAALIGESGITPGGLPSFFAGASLMPAESYVPPANAKDLAKPKKVRIVAIGHGGWSSGPELKPAQEALALYSLNWMLGRDDRLPRDEKKWEYPRLDLTEREQTWWRWGVFLGLPALFAYLGLVVLMVRRMR
jgi:hypothetical protein